MLISNKSGGFSIMCVPHVILMNYNYITLFCPQCTSLWCIMASQLRIKCSLASVWYSVFPYVQVGL